MPMRDGGWRQETPCKFMGQLAWCIQQQTKTTVSNKVEGEKGHPGLSSALCIHARAHTDLHTHAHMHRVSGRSHSVSLVCWLMPSERVRRYGTKDST